MKTKNYEDEVTHCKYCSLKCIASDCECICHDISLCHSCKCMTHTIENRCGKCGGNK